MSERHNFTRRAFLAGAGATVSTAALATVIIPALAADPQQAKRERMSSALSELRAAMEDFYGLPVQSNSALLTKGGVVSLGCLSDPRDYLCWYVNEADTPDDHPLRLSHLASKRRSYGIPARAFVHRHSPLGRMQCAVANTTSGRLARRRRPGDAQLFEGRDDVRSNCQR